MRLPSTLGWLSLAVAASLAPTVAAAPEPKRDWILRDLEARLVRDGRLGWAGFAIGSFVHFRTTWLDGRPTTESRETLTKDGEKTVIRVESRQGDEAWKKGFEYPFAITQAKGAEPRIEGLGNETVEVGGRSVACTKQRWTRFVDGKPAKPELVVWIGPTEGPVKWEVDVGDGWKSTFLVLRDDVDWKVEGKTLRCREVRRIGVPTTPGLVGTFDGTELWCDAVPDRVVRKETVGPFTPGAPSKQVRELIAYGGVLLPR